MSDDPVTHRKRPALSAAARRGERQAAALRENLKRRKDAARGRATPGDKGSNETDLSQPGTKPDPNR